MEKTQSTEGTKNEPVIPSQETMRKAVNLDLDAAIYFLHALKANPDFVNELADKIRSRYTEGAALIDSVGKTKLQSDGTD